jgi:tRNA threonylcarbamoyladenosine biosynthesis protein TsaE
MSPIQTSSDVMRFECYTPEETSSFLSALFDFAQGEVIWLLEGEMGAGKTTFVRQCGDYLGFVEPVQSPTFSIVNEYRANNGNIYYHFDFYRINSEREAFEIGCEDYFYSGNMCFIEWSSRISSLLPEKQLIIKIDVISEHARAYTITRVPANNK